MSVGTNVTGLRIKERREALKMSQLALAYRISSTPTQIFRYEKGENDPTGRVLALLARALETSTDYLLGLVDDPTARHVIENHQ